MKSKLLFPAAAILLLTNLFAFTASTFENKNAKAEEEIKELILKSYVNGAFNALDPDAMRAGFHPDFAIFSADGE
ncbi:MAG: hypothetical protein J5I94_13885, partial [Phaeodactylibacter sp.]|nr:hypothetical protein [Phaeodactylibacter sp.]